MGVFGQYSYLIELLNILSDINIMYWLLKLGDKISLVLQVLARLRMFIVPALVLGDILF